MGALGNLEHERFCQALHTRIWAGERRAVALPGAYRESVYRGSDTDDAAIYPNARRLAQRKEIKARLSELSDVAGKLANIDAAWAMLKLKAFADANLDDYLGPPDGSGTRFFDLRGVSREKLASLGELQIEDETKVGGDDDDSRRILKTKLKLHDPIGAIGMMAKIAGWAAPTKLAATDPSGKNAAPLVAAPTINLYGRPDYVDPAPVPTAQGA